PDLPPERGRQARALCDRRYRAGDVRPVARTRRRAARSEVNRFNIPIHVRLLEAKQKRREPTQTRVGSLCKLNCKCPLCAAWLSAAMRKRTYSAGAASSAGLAALVFLFCFSTRLPSLS